MLNITHTCTDHEATIGVEGLSRSVQMLHLTDVHLLHYDERDADHADACRDFCERFANNECDRSGRSYAPDKAFERVMCEAATMNLDLLALTGDIVHYPSLAAIEHLTAIVNDLGVPAMYTCGNHDVHFTDEPVNHERRQAWLSRFKSLHGERSDYEVREIANMRFVAVDSFDCQISAQQLAFFEQQLAADVPVVVLTHIPVSLPTLRARTIQEMDAPVLMGDPDWSVASRDEWQITEDTPETLEFVRLITQTPNVVACFCGHIHFAHHDAMGPRAVQYVGKPGFRGGRRLVEFKPL